MKEEIEKRLVKTSMGNLEEYTAFCLVQESLRLARLYDIKIEDAVETMISLVYQWFNDDCRYIQTNEGYCLQLSSREIESIVDFLYNDKVKLVKI